MKNLLSTLMFLLFIPLANANLVNDKRIIEITVTKIDLAQATDSNFSGNDHSFREHSIDGVSAPELSIGIHGSRPIDDNMYIYGGEYITRRIRKVGDKIELPLSELLDENEYSIREYGIVSFDDFNLKLVLGETDWFFTIAPPGIPFMGFQNNEVERFKETFSIKDLVENEFVTFTYSDPITGLSVEAKATLISETKYGNIPQIRSF